MKKTVWVVVADEAIARVLEWHPEREALEPVHQLTDAAAHAQGADLRRDAEGRRGNTVTTSAGDSETHLEAGRFARRVVEYLDDALTKERFAALKVVAAPRFLGLFRQASSDRLAGVITDSLDKDLIHAQDQEIAARLFERQAH